MAMTIQTPLKDTLSSVFGYLSNPRWLYHFALGALPLTNPTPGPYPKNLIIDTDIFSDVDDAGALLIASTHKSVNLLAVNVNVQSSYSALAASAIVSHYKKDPVPIGLRHPITNDSFFDSWSFELGEYASKVAYHSSGGTLQWGEAEKAWDPVTLYRKTLSEQKDQSVTIASIGFFENLSGLLNSTADQYSLLSGSDLVRSKVSELVVMGGEYPSGREFNFYGDNPLATRQVIQSWPGPVTFLGYDLGKNVLTGAPLTVKALPNDPVGAAYRWYTGYNISRASWDPLTVLYACEGLGSIFEWGNEDGWNKVLGDGSNVWVEDPGKTDQHWLRLKVNEETAARRIDEMFLEAALAAQEP